MFKRTLLICFLCGALSATAQEAKTITGVITDENGPVPGASVFVKGTNTGTITDMDGRYSIRAAEGQELEVAFVGYETETIGVGEATNYDIRLREEAILLDEFVAVGYAKVQRKDLTGATSSVSADDLASVPVVTAAQALQGKAAGVNVVTSSGAPGASSDITVRGGTSITQSTKPLYIVDGFEMDDALANIDINDIESIDILKDASSTAIYGARGSNGIILITTKNADKNKTKVTYNGYVSVDKISKKLDMIDGAEEFAAMNYEMALLNEKEQTYINYFDAGVAKSDADFYTGAYERMKSRYAGAETIDWQDKMLGEAALSQSHNISVSVGNDKTQLLVTFSHRNQNGILAHHGLLKNSARIKLSTKLYEHIKMDANVMYAHTNTDGGGAYGGMKYILMQPIHGGTLYTLDELFNTQTYKDLRERENAFDTPNPNIQLEASQSNKKHKLLTLNAGVDIDFLKHFTYRISGSHTTSNTKSTSFADENSTAYLTDPVNTGINGSIGKSESAKWQLTNTLSYDNTLAEKHKVGILVGHEISHSESSSTSMTLNKFPYPNLFGLDNISSASVSDKSSGHSTSGIVSAFGRVNYSFAERYLLTATLRADGSSKFAKDNRWGIFPSAAVAWRVSEEDFFQNGDVASVVNNMKLRLGYGTTGNCNISNNMYATNINQTTYPMNNEEGTLAYTISGTLGNKDLRWETLKSANVGLDVSFLQSKINLTIEWYNNTIDDLLLLSKIPTSTGYSNQYQNIGQMTNRGWEFTLSTTNIKTDHLKWTTDFNIALNKNNVDRLEGEIQSKTFTAGSNRSGSVNYYATVGESLGDMYGYKYEGVYTTSDFADDAMTTMREGVVLPEGKTAKDISVGDQKFAADGTDDNGQPIFSRKEQKIGNGTPKAFGGMTNTLTVFGFDLSLFVKFAVGQDIYNATKHSMSPYSLFQNTQKEFGNYYRTVDPQTGRRATSAEVLRTLNPDESGRTWSLSTNNLGNITYPSSYFVEDGSYLRFATLTLGYTLPKDLTQKAYIQNARVYFTVNNLATITNYSGYDPEVSSAKDEVVCTPGYDSSTYPRSRSFVVGLNLTF